MNQQDAEVINLVKKYFPLGLQDYKFKDQAMGEVKSDDPDSTNPSLTVPANFAEGQGGYRESTMHGALPTNPQLPFPMPPLYNGYPLYPLELGFDHRFTSPTGHPYFAVPMTEISASEVDLSTFSPAIGAFPPTQSLSDANQCKSDSESGESAISSSYSSRESRPPTVVVANPWAPRPMESVYSAPMFSPTAWPIQNIVYPYFSVPFNPGTLNSFPYLLPSTNPLSPPPNMFDYPFPASPLTVSPGPHTGLFPHQSSARKAK